jgi:hypothetical protein
MPRERLRETLRTLHGELESADTLDPQSRELLTRALNEIQSALDRGAGSSTDADAPWGDRLAETPARLEATHPGVAEAVRRVVDALAALGI